MRQLSGVLHMAHNSGFSPAFLYIHHFPPLAITSWLRVNGELTRHWENITGSGQETTDLLQYILLGNSGNDRLLTWFLHFAANYEFIENVMCFFKVEYNVEFANLKQIKNKLYLIYHKIVTVFTQWKTVVETITMPLKLLDWRANTTTSYYKAKLFESIWAVFNICISEHSRRLT